MAISTQNTDILTASLGRPVALAYGRHVVGGNVILMDQSEPEYTVAFIALGEGEWDGVEELWVNGRQLDISTPENYQFHKGLPGELSSNGTLDPEGSGSLYPFTADGDQMVDSLTPPGVQGLTFSRTCYLSLKIPLDVFAPGPGLQFQGVFRTRKVRTFNAQGVQTGYVYSENPAWQIADLLTVTRGLPDFRIDWASFAAAAAYCAQPVFGSEAPRFVSHIAFTREADFDQALEAVLATCRGFLTDTEGSIKLRIDQPRSPVFDFTMHNIVEDSFSAQWMDTRATVNRLELRFRDMDNDFAVMNKVWNHPAQQSRTGRIVAAAMDLGNVPQHQAERIGNYLLTRAIDNNLYCRLQGTQASLQVMPGDVVRVTHDAAPWASAAPGAFETFEVLECSDNPDETRDFLLQLYRAETYSDSSGPAQNLEGSIVRSRASAPPPPPLWSLSANLSGELRLGFAIPQGADYRTGDLTLLADEEPYRITTSLTTALEADETQMQVGGSAGFRVGDYVNLGTEIVQIAGPGVRGAPPTATTWEIARAQKLTEAAAAAAGAVVYRLTEIPLHFVLPPGYSLAHPTVNLDDSAQYHVTRFRPGRLRILHAALRFSGAAGASEIAGRGFAVGAFEPQVEGTLAGMRTSSGGLGTLQVPGPLATGDDLVMPLVIPNGASIGVVYATVAKAPVGQPIRLQLRLGEEDFGPPAEIPEAPEGPSGSGVFVSGAAKGNLGGLPLSVVILQTGSDEPGEDLTVYVTV